MCPNHIFKDKSVRLGMFSTDEQSPAILFSCPPLNIQAEKVVEVAHLVRVTMHTRAHTTQSLIALKTDADKLTGFY